MKLIKQFVTDKKTPHIVFWRRFALMLIIVSTALIFTLPAFAQTKYIITDGSNVIVCMSNSSDPQIVLKDAGLHLGESDTFTTSTNDGVSEIHINRVQMISVREGGQVYIVGSYGGTVEDVLHSLDITLSDSDILSCGLDTKTYDGMSIEITRVSLETDHYQEAIPFDTLVFESSSVPPGEEVLLIEGKEGISSFEAQITYQNGIEVNRTILSQKQVSSPQDAVVLKGIDRTLMRQTFQNVEDYVIADSWYTYLPPVADDGVEQYVPGTQLSYHSAVRFDATAYTCNCPQYVGDRRTFTGTAARVGAIAVDPRVIPLGTKMFIASADGEFVYGYCVAEDTGGVIKGNLVDLYYDTLEECVQFGRRDIIIYFLD